MPFPFQVVTQTTKQFSHFNNTIVILFFLVSNSETLTRSLSKHSISRSEYLREQIKHKTKNKRQTYFMSFFIYLSVMMLYLCCIRNLLRYIYIKKSSLTNYLVPFLNNNFVASEVLSTTFVSNKLQLQSKTLTQDYVSFYQKNTFSVTHYCCSSSQKFSLNKKH